jgi:hypothetical protein
MQTERRELQGERLERVSRPKHQVQIRVRPTAADSVASAPPKLGDESRVRAKAAERSIVPPTRVMTARSSGSDGRREPRQETNGSADERRTRRRSRQSLGPPPRARAARWWSALPSRARVWNEPRGPSRNQRASGTETIRGLRTRGAFRVRRALRDAWRA